MIHLNGNGAQCNQDTEDRQSELVCLKIKELLEEMFSDRHLAEDSFLLKHVQKNKQGYVSLKLLTCLKKIKALSTNWYMTLAAADCSDLLELNAECTKVRRKEPLPQWLMCSPTSRFILIRKASEQQSRDDRADPRPLSLLPRILQMFDMPDNVASFWILRPGDELPKELRCYTKRHKEIGQLLCTVMKFSSLESVRKALSSLKEGKIDGRGLCVVPLGWQSVQDLKSEPLEKNKEDVACFTGDQQFSEETGEAHLPQASQDNSSSTDWSSEDRNAMVSQCPWVLKRKSAASSAKLEKAEHLNTTSLILTVLRQPFGPDGTKGFHARRQRQKNPCGDLKED